MEDIEELLQDQATEDNQMPLPTYTDLPIPLSTMSSGDRLGYVAYNTCVGLCAKASNRGCTKAREFAENSFAYLRTVFRLEMLVENQKMLPESHSSVPVCKGCAAKEKDRRIKVQVIKLQMAPDVKSEIVRRTILYNPSSWLKARVSTLFATSSADKEMYTCLIRLKSSSEEPIQMHAGSGGTHIFQLESLEDDIIVKVQDSKLNNSGHVVVPVAAIFENPDKKIHWWSLTQGQEHEAGKIKLHISFVTTPADKLHKVSDVLQPKPEPLTYTMVYGAVLEAVVRGQNFDPRNVSLWKWLVYEAASHFGFSRTYANLRYLSHVMDVSIPTADCTSLVYDLLLQVVQGHSKNSLSHVHSRLRGETEEKIKSFLASIFQNYKSLNEQVPSGTIDIVAVLKKSIRIYECIYDMSCPEVKNKLYSYFKAAVEERRHHLFRSDEYDRGNILIESDEVSKACEKMELLCEHVKNEIIADLDIHECGILPSYINLSNLSSRTYGADLLRRLEFFLAAHPRSSVPSSHVADVVIQVACIVKDLACPNIDDAQNGSSPEESFCLYFRAWFHEMRFSLLESCKKPIEDDKFTPTLHSYQVIRRRWPHNTFSLENVIADMEKAVIEHLDTQCGVVSLNSTYSRHFVVRELGVRLNIMKSLLDNLHPTIERILNSWPGGSHAILGRENEARGDRLNEVEVMLKSKIRFQLETVVQKLGENTRLENVKELHEILTSSKVCPTYFEVEGVMSVWKGKITDTIKFIHCVFERDLFIESCRDYWNLMGQDMLGILSSANSNTKDDSWYKRLRIAVSILEETFTSQMSHLLGSTMEDKDRSPPARIVEVCSMLWKDTGQRFRQVGVIDTLL